MLLLIFGPPRGLLGRHLRPSISRIKLFYRAGFGRRIRAKIGLVDHTVMADHQGHNSRNTVILGIGQNRKTTDIVVSDYIIIGAVRSRRRSR